MRRGRKLHPFILIALLSFSGLCAARDRIEIVGSSTVYPFSLRVAERFAKFTGHPTPAIRSTGTRKGAELFCEGLGDDHADIVNTSRRLSQREESAVLPGDAPATSPCIGKDRSL